MAKQGTQRTIRCYHCRHRFEVGGRAMTTSCPKCSKSLLVDDVEVKTLEAVRKIQTCGRLVVRKKGHVIAQHVEAHGGIEVEGIMEANVLSGSTVKICAKAVWKGGCNAPSIIIEDGCRIAGGYFVIPDNSVVLHDLGEPGPTEGEPGAATAANGSPSAGTAEPPAVQIPPAAAASSSSVPAALGPRPSNVPHSSSSRVRR
jgi:hypothetical protein